MSSYSIPTAVLTACMYLVAGPVARAQDSEGAEDARFSRPWAAGFAVQAEESDSRSLYATFNIGMTENTWLFFSAGESEFSDDFSSISSSSLFAGVDQRFGRLGFTLNLESWGDSEEVESNDIGGSFYVIGERFRVDLELEDRDITLSPLLSDRVNLEIAGEGVGLRTRVELAPRWQLYLRGMSYDYEYNLPAAPATDSVAGFCGRLVNVTCDEVNRFVALLERANRFVTSTLGDASFLDSKATMGLEWRVGSSLINLSFTQDRAADEARSETTSVTASVLFPISRRVDMEVNVGTVDSEIFQSSVYGGLFFLVYGGG